MKNLFLLIAFLGVTSFTKVQADLQFNRALTLIAGQSYTVPNGKVFKIESINMNNTTVCIPRSSQVSLSCRNQNGSFSSRTHGVYNFITYMTIANMNFTTPSFAGSCNDGVNDSCWNWNFGGISLNTPIWLEAGKQVNIHSGVSNILISGIEFNVIQ